MVNAPVIPAAACPAISHSISYEPAPSTPRSSTSDSPFWRSFVVCPAIAQVVGLGVDVGDADLDVARRRRQLVGGERERAELDIEHRQRRTGGRADRVVLVEDRDQERDHERSDRDEERGPTQHGAIF